MKRSKGKSLIRSIIFGFIGLLVVIALFASCMAGNLDESQEETNRVDEAVDQEREDVADVEADEKIAEAEEKAKAEAEVEKAKEAQSILEQDALALIQESFKGIGTVEFDPETKFFLITSTDPGFMEEIVLVSEGQLPMSNWDALVDSTVYLSNSIQSLLGLGYSVVMVNPSNTDNFLIVVQDGIVIYDAMEESI